MPSRRRTALPQLVALGAALAASPPAGAQQPASHGPQPPGTLACIQRIPASAMRPTTVYVVARMRDSTLQDALLSADALTRVTAEEVQALLGASPGQLPRGEPAVTWLGLDADLLLTAHRDGRLTWRPDSVSSLALTQDTTAQAAAVLLGRALERLREKGRGYFWPPTVAVDSLTFRFVLSSAPYNRKGKRSEPGEPRAVPLVLVDAPWEEQVKLVRTPRITYPERARSDLAAGIATMHFVIDTAGRVEPASIRDPLEPHAAKLDAAMIPYYQAFVAAVRSGLPTGRYSAALVGGCPIRRLVQQPFHFQFAR
jgi:hypothetical protein